MVNSSSFNSLTMHQSLFSPIERKIINSVFMVLSIAGILNNSIALLVFYRENALRRPCAIILTNLFIADVMSSFTIQPYIWIDPTKIKSDDTVANIICAVSVGIALLIVCMSVNSLSLSALTILRYLSIVRNYHGIFVTSNAIAKRYCIFTWMIGVMFMLLSASSSKYNQRQAMCYREWPKGIDGVLFSILTTILTLVIPAMLIIFCYSALLARIWGQSRSTNLNNSVAIRKKRAVAILLGLLIVSFFLCWSPLFFLWFLGRALNYFSNGKQGEYSRQRWLRITLLFTMLNSAMDPLIYAYSSSDFRKGIVRFAHLIRDSVLRFNHPNRVEPASHGDSPV